MEEGRRTRRPALSRDRGAPACARRPATARRTSPRRSAFSLIEVLIALALLLAIAALVVPTLAGAGRESAIRDVREQLSAATMVARAEARRRGAVVELTVVDRALHVRVVERGAARTVDDLGPVPDVLEFDFASLASSDGAASDLDTAEPSDPGASPTPGVPRPVVLARFWPDGHAEIVQPWAIIQVRDAYVLRPRINAWTGVLTFEERGLDAGREPADEETRDDALDAPLPADMPASDMAPSREPAPETPRTRARGGA